MVVQCTLYEIYHLKLCNFVAVERVKMSPLSCSWTLFATQRESPCPVTPILLTPSPWHPLLSSQFLWICLVYTLHINGIIPYVTLCAWFLSLGISFFFPAVPCSLWDFSDWAQHRVLTTGLPGKPLPWHNVVKVCTWFNMNQFLIF